MSNKGLQVLDGQLFRIKEDGTAEVLFPDDYTIEEAKRDINLLVLSLSKEIEKRNSRQTHTSDPRQAKPL